MFLSAIAAEHIGWAGVRRWYRAFPGQKKLAWWTTL